MHLERHESDEGSALKAERRTLQATSPGLANESARRAASSWPICFKSADSPAAIYTTPRNRGFFTCFSTASLLRDAASRTSAAE